MARPGPWQLRKERAVAGTGSASNALLIPPLARHLSALLDAVRAPSLGTRRIVTAGLAAASSLFLAFEAASQLRSFTLKYHDEYSYQIQAFMVAHGRLWMPAHPLADFFQSFQFIAEPVYGSVYFPGAAMLYAPGIWLSLPHWVMPVVLSGLIVALVYRIFT